MIEELNYILSVVLFVLHSCAFSGILLHIGGYVLAGVVLLCYLDMKEVRNNYIQ